jgi:hypothetical protein
MTKSHANNTLTPVRPGAHHIRQDILNLMEREIGQFNSEYAELGSIFNSIEYLTYNKASKSRSKRAILPFVGSVL